MYQEVLERFLRHKVAVVGGVALSIIILAAIFAPYVSPHDAFKQDIANTRQPPDSTNLFGTDAFGRDVLSRIIWGGRVSLAIGFLAMLLSSVIGVTIGSLAGFYGGGAEWLLMRLTDMFYSIPALLLILILVAVFGPGFWMTVLAIGLVFWPATARVVRAEFLKIRSEPYVEAAQALGASPSRLIFLHFLPNAMAPLIVQMTLQLAQAIVLEAGLSYLGLGAQPPFPSWGNILAEGHMHLRTAPWIATFGGVFIWITVLSFNFIGDGLRDSLDPSLIGR